MYIYVSFEELGVKALDDFFEGQLDKIELTRKREDSLFPTVLFEVGIT